VRIHPQEQRPLNTGLRPVLGDGLRDGQNVMLVERRLKRGAAVAGGAEGDPLARRGRIGGLRLIGLKKL
jgi:hypothetical protein